MLLYAYCSYIKIEFITFFNQCENIFKIEYDTRHRCELLSVMLMAILHTVTVQN